MSGTFWSIDFPALLVAVLASALCALLGSFLVLRKQAMMGDTLSHVILPGLAVAFLISGHIDPFIMALGALGACMLSVLLIKILQSFGGLPADASMGIVFTSMFALGLVLLEMQVGPRVHLDAHHALYGSLELAYWPPPISLKTLPGQIKVLLMVLTSAAAMIILFFKELRVASFDPLYAGTQSFSPFYISVGLMALVAIAAVACFEAVGSIIVIALFICPAATARMLTDNLKNHVLLSIFFGVLSAITGYILAVAAPYLLNYPHSLNAGGMIALSAGGYQLSAMLWAPRYGYLK